MIVKSKKNMSMKSNYLEHTLSGVRMKINNRMYNTETSWMELKTDYVEKGDKVDFRMIEKVYQKRNGEHFLFGICHTLDKTSGEILNTYEWITPMTDSDVMNWENKRDKRTFKYLEEKVKRETGKDVTYYRNSWGMITSREKEV